MRMMPTAAAMVAIIPTYLSSSAVFT